MKILLLEDSGETHFRLNDTLTSKGYTVYPAFQISDARDIIESDDVDIDVVVADLNVPPTGLTIKETNESIKGKIAGWVWLENYLFNVEEKWRAKTIIYSAFTDILRDNIEDFRLNGVLILKKESTVNFFQEFDDFLNKLKKSKLI